MVGLCPRGSPVFSLWIPLSSVNFYQVSPHLDFKFYVEEEDMLEIFLERNWSMKCQFGIFFERQF